MRKESEYEQKNFNFMFDFVNNHVHGIVCFLHRSYTVGRIHDFK